MIAVARKPELVQDEFLQLPISTLVESKTNPRRCFDEKRLAELTVSVKTQGVIEPIIVRRSQANGRADVFEIVAGARRYRAAKAAGRDTVPALVRHLSDEQALEIQVVENLQRADIHPLDEALGYQALIDKTGMEIAAIAAKVGKSESYIYQRLKLAALVKLAQKAFIEDKITAGHAILIARLQPKDQEEALKYCTGWHGGGVRDLADWIANNIHLDLHSAPFKKDDATLTPAGPCTTCVKRTGFQPALFPDVKKHDTCTDPTCFQAKIAAFIARRKAVMVKLGEKPIELSDEYYRSDRNGALTKNKWMEAGKKVCGSTRMGIVVDGDRLGQTLKVCADPACKVHRGAHEREQRHVATTGRNFAQERKEQAKRTARDRAIAVIVQNTKVLDTEGLRDLAKACMNNLWHEHLKAIVKRRGWEAKKAKHGGWNLAELAEKQIDGMNATEIAGLLVEYTVLGRNSGELLPKLAKAHRVNLVELEKAELMALNAKAKEKAAKQKAAAKAKLQTSAKSKSKLKKAA